MPEFPRFTVVPAPVARRCIETDREHCVQLVRQTYLDHHEGRSALPHSVFLRLPGHERDRIIGLPAYLGGQAEVAGMKWISSWPGNTARGIPRASAVLVLNDVETGFPFACLESSLISATRTAASAVLAAEVLGSGRVARRIGFVGTGVISDHVRMFFRDLDWQIDQIRLFDLDAPAAQRFADRIVRDDGPTVTVCRDVAGVFADSDLVVVATVAPTPHLSDPDLIASRPIVLNLSLRDFAPELLLQTQNIADDIDHVMRESTSLHLAEQLTGHRHFVDGDIGQVLRGDLARDPDRACVFSPFGLGVLDLAIGRWVHDVAVADGAATSIDSFFDLGVASG